MVATGPFWIHLDWDVLATDVMPAVICPIPGGLGWADLDVIVGGALADPRCVGLSAGTYNADLDGDGTVARRIVDHLARWLAAGADGPSSS